MFSKWKMLLIKPFEGLHRLSGGMVHPYLCPAGYPTQGYGIIVKDMRVPAITVAQAEASLDAVLPFYLAQALKACPALVTAPEGLRIAVADFVFNVGPAKFRASTLRRRLDAQDWEGAIDEFPKWVFGGGRKLRGLELRAQARQAVARQDL